MILKGQPANKFLTCITGATRSPFLWLSVKSVSAIKRLLLRNEESSVVN
ncbi:hypothetical protein SAMN04487894_102108, partial [Niabella drilacis]